MNIMMRAKNSLIFCLFLTAMTQVVNAVNVKNLFNENSDLEFILSGRYKPEMFWGNNISLLNSNNQVNGRPTDRILFFRHTFDIASDVVYGKKQHDTPIMEFLFSIRNKATWGNPESIINTTYSTIKLTDAVTGPHNHSIPRNLFWMREVWLRFALGKPIGLDLKNEHTFTIGAFPFELGRGIALGAAYAVSGPSLLGFYTDGIIDQYAYGARLSGDIIPKKLGYDVYAAILQSKSSNLSDTGAKIFSQEIGRRSCPVRGFGHINYIVAGRARWTVFDTESLGMFGLEPYFVFNEDPEQMVEFTADARSKLGTMGLAGEYEGDHWEFGFDYAFNLGSQKVRGWDRNQLEIQNRNGRPVFVNSDVYLNANPDLTDTPKNLDPYKTPYSPNVTVNSSGSLVNDGKNVQNLIYTNNQGEEFNSQLIGSVPGYTVDVDAPAPVQSEVTQDQLYNSRTRFRNPYTNQYEGWMMVGDASWWVYGKDLKIAVTGGLASGDENPNNETIDGTYGGFVGLQEIYSGKRVKSAFLLGGAGKAKRPLSVPVNEQSPTDYSPEVTGFTNLVFTGAGLTWTPKDWTKKFSFNPNVLAYWQQHPTKKFDIATGTNSPRDARTFLGTELNAFVKYNFLPDLIIFCVTSAFLPGGHYHDIKGKPLNADQAKALDKFNDSGFENAPVPNIGTNAAFTFNVGLEYVF